jgi:hypothetical protein
MQKWLESLEKKERIHYPYETPIQGIEILRKHEKTAKSGWVGAFSVSSRKTKIYKIYEPIIVVKNITLVGTEIAKYLILLNKPPKGYRKDTALQLEKTPPPLFANPSVFEGCYIDIKSCYYHLITKLWGLKYSRNNWIGKDKEIPPWQVPKEFEPILNEYKPIRNAIYGLLRAKNSICWVYKTNKVELRIQNIKNDLFYPDIPLAILDITHAIATIAVSKFKAKYFAIDGAILPQETAESFQEFLASYGFRFGVKSEGWTIVKNFYSYKCGDMKTLTFDKYSTAEQVQSNLIFTLTEAEEILARFKPFLL